MAKCLQDYVNYTAVELDTYVGTEGSCVYKEQSTFHTSFIPFVLSDFKHGLKAHLFRRKVGYYDPSLNGIILSIKNIKVLKNVGTMRGDDVRVHVNLTADFYIFRPVVGAIVNGSVRYIGRHGSVGAVIYRVFHVNLRLNQKMRNNFVEINQELKIRIKTFNILNVFPYIEGELLTAPSSKSIKLESVDSGIEEKDDNELTVSIKLEKDADESVEVTPIATNKKKRTKKDDSGLSVSGKLQSDANESVEVTPETKNRKKRTKKPVDTEIGLLEIKGEPASTIDTIVKSEIESPKKRKRKST